MIWVLEDRYEYPVSIDTKIVPVAFRLTSQWWLNDVIVTKNRILQIFRWIYVDFQFFFQKCDFDRVFLLIIKRKWLL